MTRPLLTQVGVDPDVLAGKVHEQLSRLPRAEGGAEPGLVARRPGRCSRRRTRTAATWATTTSRSSTSCWRWPTRSASPRTRCSTALRDGAGQPPGHDAGPRADLPGPGQVRARPDRGGPRGQARPGHRARRGDPPGDPGAVAPHQEQPRPHRRARRRQDGHRRGAGQPHHRGRRARGPQGQARRSRSTWAPWWPGPSTAASSRSA